MSASPHTNRAPLLVACVVGLAALAACKDKAPKRTPPPPAEVTGLAAVPENAQVVIGADVAKLTTSPIVSRAIEQLLMREPTLADSWSHVVDTCKIDLTNQIKHVMVALGPPGAAVGSGALLIIATGTVSEPDVASCIRTMVGKGGGTLTTKIVAGRSIYLVKDGNRTMHFAFGRADTIVLGTNEAWVVEALSTNPKIASNTPMTTWLAMIDQRAPIFAVGKVDARTGAGLAGATNGKLTKPPQGFIATFDPTEGARFLLGVFMPDSESAKQLESFAKGELLLAAGYAQMKSMGPIVNKIKVATDGNQLQLTAALTMDEVNQLLKVLDESPAPEQVTPPVVPPTGSGSQRPQ